MAVVYVLAGVVILVLLVIYDVTQKHHAIIRNFPLVGRLRYILEMVGPELRQYIVTGNNEERPFSRDQRRWVYASSKRQNNLFGFGTDEDLESTPNYLIIKHSSFPILSPEKGDEGFDPEYSLSCKKIMGGHRNRQKQFRPSSIVNVSGMSFGSMSANAIKAINIGSKLSDCLHNTGEGGISQYHLHGGSLVWQIGTGYFGCRTKNGSFSLEDFKEAITNFPQVKAIEIKLSQGAKPGKGGILPVAKISPEISRIRNIPDDRDCRSPSAHSEFHDVDSMLDFVEKLADASGGLPIGIKSAVGDMKFWKELAEKMSEEDRGVDFITIDGGEGGTGAAPLVFSDHVSFPFKIGFSMVFNEFLKRGVDKKVVFQGSGKLGFPESSILALALGADMIGVAREAMLAIGCIQAQKCHTNHCPAGVATQNKWLARGLDPELKSVRLYNYILSLRKDIKTIAQACGHDHPSDINRDQLAIIDDNFDSKSLKEIFGY